MTAKGTNSGGCCCGGCKAPPVDLNQTQVGGVSLFPDVQRYCCRCIPNQVCVQAQQGTGNLQYDLVTKYCSPASGDPIQYSAAIMVDNTDQTLNIRLAVESGNCYITCDIPGLESSGVLIDRDEPADSGFCTYGMVAKKCVQFGGSWYLASKDLSITVSEPQTISLKEKIRCAGCNCICKCMCFNIWSQASDGELQIISNSQISCTSGVIITQSGCNGSGSYELPPSYSWSNSGWVVTLGGKTDHMISGHTVESGVAISGICSVQDLVWRGDELNHTIYGSGETPQVTYEWDVNDKIAKEFKWAGQSQDESSFVRFEGFDYSTSGWTTLVNSNGRPSGFPYNRVITYDLPSIYTGTGSEEGFVKLRLTAVSGYYLTTDMIRVLTEDCCEMILTPPESISLVSPPSKISLRPSGNNPCPNPSPYWANLADTGGNYYSVFLECNWCGEFCGSVNTFCCNRPLPKILFAEIATDCSGCAITTIPITAVGGVSPWNGVSTGSNCGNPMSVGFNCIGSGLFSLTLQSYGGCNGTLYGSGTCDPLAVSFAGTLSGGLGCCGPFGGMASTLNVSVTVIE